MKINHLIIGNGRWGKKIFKYLIKKKFYKKIYVKDSKNFYLLYPYYRILNFKYLNRYISKKDTTHICIPKNLQIKYFQKIKTNMILEKPIVSANKQSEFKKFVHIFTKKKEMTLVNYIDLFNNKITKIKKKELKNNMLFLYYKKNEKYKDLNEFLDDWLDHPLSIVLYLFKKFSKFKIDLKTFNRKTFECEFILNYKVDNSIIKILISNHTKQNIRSFKLINNKNKILIDFKKINSFKNLYLSLLKNKNNLLHQKLIFHKKIYYEKIKILSQSKKILKKQVFS